ncbi:MAG: hypothetical protein AAF146_15350 [Bacteroidota bacterium]
MMKKNTPDRVERGLQQRVNDYEFASDPRWWEAMEQLLQLEVAREAADSVAPKAGLNTKWGGVWTSGTVLATLALGVLLVLALGWWWGQASPASGSPSEGLVGAEGVAAPVTEAQASKYLLEERQAVPISTAPNSPEEVLETGPEGSARGGVPPTLGMASPLSPVATEVQPPLAAGSRETSEPEPILGGADSKTSIVDSIDVEWSKASLELLSTLVSTLPPPPQPSTVPIVEKDKRRGRLYTPWSIGIGLGLLQPEALRSAGSDRYDLADQFSFRGRRAWLAELDLAYQFTLRWRARLGLRFSPRRYERGSLEEFYRSPVSGLRSNTFLVHQYQLPLDFDWRWHYQWSSRLGGGLAIRQQRGRLDGPTEPDLDQLLDDWIVARSAFATFGLGYHRGPWDLHLTGTYWWRNLLEDPGGNYRTHPVNTTGRLQFHLSFAYRWEIVKRPTADVNSSK